MNPRNQRDKGLSIPSRSLTRVRSDRYDNTFGIFVIKMQSKIKGKVKKRKAIIKRRKINMMKIDPGAIGFTSGFSKEHKYFTMGEQITVEPLTELSIVMRISRYDHVYTHHVRDK